MNEATHHNAGQHNSRGHRDTIDKNHANKLEEESAEEQSYTPSHSRASTKASNQAGLTDNSRVAKATLRNSIVVAADGKETIYFKRSTWARLTINGSHTGNHQVEDNLVEPTWRTY